jgi:hypothetical protein
MPSAGKCIHYLRDVAFISNESLGLSHDHYAQMPIPVVENNKLIVYFTSRDEKNQSIPMNVEMVVSPKILVGSANLVPLEFGKDGAFDDSGIMLSSILDGELGQMIYYIGWNRSSNVPYRLSIGLATRKSYSHHFSKFSPGPIVDRSPSNPYFVTTPDITRIDGKYRMLFSSGTDWILHNERKESIYSLASATSDDGINWDHFKHINKSDSNLCTARPFRFESHTYFSERPAFGFREKGFGYRIRATRNLEDPFQQTCELVWNGGRDDRDRAYASVIEFSGKRYIFYNGEKFGKNGFHIAEEQIENR